MSNYAIINNTGLVVNVIVAEEDYSPPENCTKELTGNSGASIGWTYSNGSFTPPISPIPTPEEAHALLVQQATLALGTSDITIVRCYSASVVVPSDWQTYRNALRAIMNGSDTTSTTLPAMPPYPQGT